MLVYRTYVWLLSLSAPPPFVIGSIIISTPPHGSSPLHHHLTMPAFSATRSMTDTRQLPGGRAATRRGAPALRENGRTWHCLWSHPCSKYRIPAHPCMWDDPPHPHTHPHPTAHNLHTDPNQTTTPIPNPTYTGRLPKAPQRPRLCAPASNAAAAVHPGHQRRQQHHRQRAVLHRHRHGRRGRWARWAQARRLINRVYVRLFMPKSNRLPSAPGRVCTGK